MALNFDPRKSITDRGLSDVGTALFVKGTNGKYHFFIPVTNMPATGSAPDQAEKTVTTDQKKTYIKGRQDNPPKEFTYYAHRNNFIKIKELSESASSFDFLQLNPDFTGNKFSGSISYYQDEVSVGNNLTGKLVITVSQSDENPTINVYDLLEDIVVFENEVPDTIYLNSSGTYAITLQTNPATATISATADTQGVATAQASEKKVTINAVAAGSCLVTIKATSSGYSEGMTTILVVVTDEE